MGTAQPRPAPLQLESLAPAELLERYCETHSELYVLALWERYCDLKARRGEIYQDLRRKSHRYCPPGYNPDWMLYGSHTRAYLRFSRHIGQFVGRLETPQFKRYKRLLIEASVIDEYWFVKGEGQAIWVHIHPDYEVVDDTGRIHRTERTEELEAWEDLDRARLADERRLAELQGDIPEPTEETHEAETAATAELEPVLEDERPPAAGCEGERAYSRRGMAQPIPRPDAAISTKERKYIIRFLILDHLATAGKAHSSNCIIRHYFHDWSKARLAILIYGDPPDIRTRNRNEKRVRDTLAHDLRSMHQALKARFGITSLREV